MAKTITLDRGHVSLVGGGPGDPELLTIKAMRRLREADLIVYDYLANPEHLQYAKASAIKISVGKRFRYRRLSQQKINDLIIGAAKKGKRVVRLKGGDPYLFGRGGEEALLLKKSGISFEVVPGVTSATACAAYSGIPLTHRDHNASVTFLTGHRAHDENLDSVDWDRIVSLKGTLVIYMGFYNLSKIAEKLIRYGMPPATKVCVIQWGTLPWQKSCEGTLENISRIVSLKKMGAPSIIIVGDVVALKKDLNWFERLPLFGKRVVITRPKDKVSVLKEKLRELGAWTIEMPAIEIAPLKNFSALDRALKQIDRFDWLIFTSTYGVEAFFDRLNNFHGKDARVLSRLKIVCVGPETVLSLKKQGIACDLQPKRFEASAIADELKKRYKELRGKKILLVRANIAPPELEKKLSKAGVQITRATAYRTIFPKPIAKPVRDDLLRNGVDYIAFASSSAVLHTSKMIGLKGLKKIAKKACFASIGPVTSGTLRAHGLRVGCEADPFTIDGLVSAVVKHEKKSRKD